MAFYVASLAQLVEQMTLNHWVAGSSPAGSTIQQHFNERYFSSIKTRQNLILTGFLLPTQKKHKRDFGRFRLLG